MHGNGQHPSVTELIKVLNLHGEGNRFITGSSAISSAIVWLLLSAF